MPIMIGMIVGFALSLLCTPFYDCDNRISFEFLTSNNNHSRIMRLRRNMHLRSNQEQQQMDIIEQENQKHIDEFEPRINLQGKPKKTQKPTQKLIRPRYISSELNIRKKLFVGILSTTNKLTHMASFLNETISEYSNKITFFVSNADMNEKLLLDTTPSGVSVVNFNDDHYNLLPFHSFKYVIDNYIKNYDWFFFVTDDTYVRAAKLRELFNHLSITQDLYMGYSRDDKYSVYCSLSAGIIFSNTLLIKLLPEMEWCIKNSYSDDPSENIGRCVLHSTNLGCTKTANGQNVNFYLDENFDIELNLENLLKSSTFNNSLSVNSIKNIETMKKLQIYFDNVEMNEISEKIEKIENNIMETVCHTPEGCDSMSWPLGVPPNFKSTSRHDIIRWDYFNKTHVFLGTDFDVVTEMPENYQLDIDEVIDFSMNNLNKDENFNRYDLVKLLNGYKQFDPTRGASYILDLILNDKKNNFKLHKRVNVMRPLGLIELMTAPYVTESSKITLVITIALEYDQEVIAEFFSSYEKFILEVKETAEKLNLFIIYLTKSNQEENLRLKEKRYFSYVKEVINNLTKKYTSLISTSSRILQAEVELNNMSVYFSESYRQIKVIEYVSQKLSNDALIFMATPCIEIQSEFLNRVRLNTIKNFQVFFPIAFSEYMPNIIYSSKPFPKEVEINKNIGYFNRFSYEFVSFYNSDFIGTKQAYFLNLDEEKKSKLINSSYTNKIDLSDYVSSIYDLFVSNTNLHILRATDQAFKCRWNLIENCEKKNSLEENTECYNQRYFGLGTKAELAMHLMKNFQKISN